MTEPNERLMRARAAAGFTSAAQAAEVNGWAVPTYQSHENGNRGIRPAAARKYAVAFGVTAAWILTGSSLTKIKMLPVYKEIDDVPIGAQVSHKANRGGDVAKDLDEIPLPPGCPDDSHAIQVSDNSSWPVYREGDIVVFGPIISGVETILKEAVGKECIVSVSEGRYEIRIVEVGDEEARVNLRGYNSPPIVNALPRWVAPVLWLKRKN